MVECFFAQLFAGVGEDGVGERGGGEGDAGDGLWGRGLSNLIGGEEGGHVARLGGPAIVIKG